MSTKAYAMYHKLMWLLVLFSQVQCDWVEISQNHYTKDPIQKVAGTFEYTTKANKYNNHSLTERTRNRGVVDKVSYVGNIRRVPSPRVITTAFRTRNGDKNIFDEHFVDDTDSDQNERYIYISIRPNIDTFDKLTKKPDTITQQGIESVARIKDIKQNIDSKKTPFRIPVANSFSRRKVFNDVIEVLDINRRNQITKASSAEPTNGNSKIVNADDNPNDNFYRTKNLQIQGVTHNDNLKPKETLAVSVNEVRKSPKIKLIYRANNDSSDGDTKNINLKHEEEAIINNTKERFSNLGSMKFKSHRRQGNIESLNKSAHIDEIVHNIKNVNQSEDFINVIQNTDTAFLNKSDEIIQSTANKHKFSKSKVMSDAAKVNTRNGMWKLMKLVTDIIYKNTQRSFKSKIKYLERLKSTILASIEDQIDCAWPDDVPPSGAPRRSRSAQPRGHLEFPSSESTLMTISFLTFAVFLIKLVLQVIHTYKNKTMMVAPTVVAAVGRAAAALKHQSHQ